MLTGFRSEWLLTCGFRGVWAPISWKLWESAFSSGIFVVFWCLTECPATGAGHAETRAFPCTTLTRETHMKRISALALAMGLMVGCEPAADAPKTDAAAQTAPAVDPAEAMKKSMEGAGAALNDAAQTAGEAAGDAAKAAGEAAGDAAKAAGEAAGDAAKAAGEAAADAAKPAETPAP